MLSRLVVVIVVFAAIGCIGTLKPNYKQYSYTHKSIYNGSVVREIPIWIDKNFGDSDQISIDDAINQWNYALNGYIKLTVVDNKFDMEVSKIKEQERLNGWLFMKVRHDDSIVPPDKPFSKTLAFCNKIDGNYMFLIRDRIDNKDVFSITLHEIGHLMGVGHTNNLLMSLNYNDFQCVDYDTISMVAKRYILSVNDLNYCVLGSN